MTEEGRYIMMKKRILSLLLAAIMVIGCLPTAFAAESGFAFETAPVEEIDTTGPMSLPAQNSSSNADTGFVPAQGETAEPAEETELTKFEPSETTRFSETEAAQLYGADDEVTFIVVVEEAPLLAEFSVGDIAAQTGAVAKRQSRQLQTLNTVKGGVRTALKSETAYEIGYTYTIATTGFSVRTAFGNKAALEAIDGVKSVYVAPTFSLPEDSLGSNVSPLTSNASTMIGANVLNETGYTGKGMRIAILDTGILVTHPSFGALSEDKLEDPITRESVEEIWDTLNAGQITSQLNKSYYNTKLPYVFNYVNGSFDVSNTFAGSDHGTHVAGIAAANKTEDSTVIGVAPDAQIVVMQVFEQGGGAGWDTIMAAMEDCVRLEVDSVNLSLGSAAGFTDADAAMLETMQLFQDSDIQLLIAAGNDTNNAYGNNWGLNKNLVTDPDIGLLGTPASYSAALAVASADNDGATQLYFTVGGEDIGYTDTARSAATIFINSFLGKTAEYVVVPNFGAEEDYAELDVEGKIALVSRGSSSFPEKQSIAQAHGAIACVIYNNASGLLNMQINDGDDNIPCVSVSKKAGAYMIEQAGDDGVGTLTVCDGTTKEFKLDRTVSDFSSWGVTPDLKLKPELTGVGGSIYSCVDPAISGSYYGTMSGTSMATPQITGAMAVLIEYLDKNYPELTGAEQRRVAADLLMSTATPLEVAEGLEYTPRAQGAGLADLVSATTSPAYLSNPDATEGRPKVEFGDDPAKTGEYTFRFTVTNLSGEEQSYTFRSSVLTEAIYEAGGMQFIDNSPYALAAQVEVQSNADLGLKYDFNDDGEITTADARVLLRHVDGTAALDESNVHYAYLDVNGDGTVDAADAKVITDYCAELEVAVDLTETIAEPVNTVTVPAGETVELTGTLTLTDEDKAYLAQFPNGIYVEGFLYADAANGENPTLTMPMVGFYGDWSDAPVFDDNGSLYDFYVYTNNSQLGTNPYIRAGKSGDEYNAFSYANPLAEIDIGMFRNAKKLAFTVTDKETGEEYFYIDGANITKTFYNASYGMIIPAFFLADYGELWDGMVGEGDDAQKLPDGTHVVYKMEAWLDDGDDIVDDSRTFEVTLDDVAPRLENAGDLQNALSTEGDRTYLELEITENQHVAAVLFVSNTGVIMGKFEVDNEPGTTFKQKFDITGFSNEFTLVLADYACNEAEYDVILNLGAQNDVKPAPAELSSDRLYGCETFDLAAVEAGWFSAKKSDFTDYRNETFDSSNRYYAAEFVNGYLIAQNAVNGNLELVTPSGTYWGAQTLIEQNGKIGDDGYWVFYDMALDYTDTVSTIYDLYGNCAGTDSLLATGWKYGGDEDGDGKDNGYNALFRVWISKWTGDFYVDAEARIVGLPEDAELLTLGCTTDGKLYGIDSNADLYSINPEARWDDTLGTNVVDCTKIGPTGFADVLDYSGVNVIQSMGYDHNTGTMYWYAHSQTKAGSYYKNINVTYTLDLATGKGTEVGTYGAGGQTCLFVPNKLESDLFTMGAKPESFSMNPYEMLMVEGQTKRMNINWSPWNCDPTAVTWSSSDETLATVDEYGFVTAKQEGEVTISAKAQIWNKWAGPWNSETQSNEGAWEDRTASCTITVVPSEEALYSYIIEDFANADNRFTWVTYSDQTPNKVTQLGKQNLTVTDPSTGETSTSPALWQGGAYYNGYVYLVTKEARDDGSGALGNATVLYKSKVNKGATPEETTFGAPEVVGYTVGIELGNMGFDYNTGRMYAVDLTNGGLAIIDLDTGDIDPLGAFSGDIGNGATAPAMCVTADGTIVVSGMFGSLYTVDPDTLATTQIGSTGNDTWYYAAMTYDYNTGSIYWNPCMSAKASPFYLVRLEQDPRDETRLNANIMDMGDVSSKAGVEQTVMFAIPDEEPETKQIPVESIDITNGDSISGLVGGTAQLNTVTEPARPTVRTRTWTSSDENVVKVDRFGVLTYTGVGEATVTVSITNKDEATYGGPFTDSIKVTVYAAAGEMRAFLTSDDGGSSYYDFWLNVNDYDVRHTTLGNTSINIYSLRVGCYYDGCFYGYNENGRFLRIDAENTNNYVQLGMDGLNHETQQVTGMAVDWNTGTMYALSRDAYGVMGALWTVNMDNGALTKVADLNASVFALAADKNGTLYAAGSPNTYTDAALYTVDKTTGECTKLLELPGARAYTGTVYSGTQQFNPAMTYDYTTNRLYLNATSDDQYMGVENSGVYMIVLDDMSVLNLGKLCVETRAGSTIKEGNATLGMLAAIPAAEEVPVSTVNGILLNKTAGRVAIGGTTTITAAVRPSNAENAAVVWESSDETVATVENGVVTGIAAGKATITATSVETPSVSATCEITVVDVSGAQSLAYTVSAEKDRLYSFNPALPAQTVEEVAVLSGGSNIKGATMGEGCMYYVIEDNFTFHLYRFDLLTKQTSSLGILEAWTGIQDIAYDPVNDLLYGVGGFYLYQYKDVSKMDGNYNSMSGYLYTMMTLSAVSCDEEGNVYYVGNDWGPVALGKTDKYLSSGTTLATNIDLSVVPGKTEMAYDSSVGLFYITDAASNIYTLAMDGTVERVDILGDGIDLNGLAIVPAKTEEP